MSYLQSQGCGIAPLEENDGGFDFSSLGTLGFWYDFDDSSTVFSDVAGTVPATLGDTVRYLSDKSGNGRHLINSVSPTYSPTLALMHGSKKAGYFNVNHSLQATSAAQHNFLYKGAAFTMAIDYKSINNGNNFLFDTTGGNASADGIYCYIYSGGDQFYTLLSNNDSHSTSSGKTTTEEPDPEYMLILTNQTKRGRADGVLLIANDITTGYSQITLGAQTSVAATGSPAAGDSPYPFTMGNLAASFGGWIGYIRRMVCYTSFLNSTDRTTLMTKIRL